MRGDFFRIINISPAAFNACFNENISALKENITRNLPVLTTADFIVFPRNFISGNGNGALNLNADFQNGVRKAFGNIVSFLTDKLPKTTFILTVKEVCEHCGRPFTVKYVINKNQTEKIADCGCIPYLTYSTHTFKTNKLRFCVFDIKTYDKFADLMQNTAVRFSDVVFLSAGLPSFVGSSQRLSGTIRTISDAYKNVVSMSNASSANTVAPNIYKGQCSIYNNGVSVSKKFRASKSFIYSIADIDSEALIKNRSNVKKISSENLHYVDYTTIPTEKKPEFCDFPREPFLSGLKGSELDAQFEEMQRLQAMSIAGRLYARSRIDPSLNKIILGVSGGVDSTAALLAAVRAADIAGIPPENVIAVTLPCFGTSTRTYDNALKLIGSLGAKHIDININNSVSRHFADIGHDPAIRDIVYENAQARERTQVLLDLSNKYNALELATSDLSEIALGFSTFGGDHIGQFAVNACFTKTTLLHLLDYTARVVDNNDLREVLLDILATPISPELLPPDESGSINQKTEEVLGPYILHEHFLYYFLKYNFAAEKLFYYAKRAFEGEYDGAQIKSCLKTFARRFCTSQFKRACAPEGSALTTLNLFGYSIPSDFNPTELLRAIDSL